MAEEKKEEAGEGKPAEPAKGGSKKTLLIVGGLVGLLLLIGAPVAFFMIKGQKADQEHLAADAAQDGHDSSVHEGTGEEDELEEGEEALGAIFPLESFVVNLAGGKYVRVQMQLEFVGRDVPRRFYLKLVPLRDAVIALLANRTADDLSSQKGRDQLKGDVKDIVNEMMRKEDVKRVYFTQFVIQ